MIVNSLVEIRKLKQNKNIDLFRFDFTKTPVKDTHLENIFGIVKNFKKVCSVDLINIDCNKVIIRELIIITFTNYKFTELNKNLSDEKLFNSLIKNKSVFN
jgi:hypothetical protein